MGNEKVKLGEPVKVIGDYVLTPCKNADNEKISYWLSKKGYTVAVYAFTPLDQRDLLYHLKDDTLQGYILYYENVLSSMPKREESAPEEYPKLSKSVKGYIRNYLPEETMKNGNKQYIGYFLECSQCYSLASKLGWTESIETSYVRGSVFNKEQLFSCDWVEGEIYVTLFKDEDAYEKELLRVKKWYEENS